MASREERRQSQRVLFDKTFKIMGHFSFLEKEAKPIVIQILNMSAGGISFTLRSSRDIELNMGDKIVFEEIVNKDSQSFSLKMRAIIIWIMEDSTMEYTGVGSKFIDVDPENISKIDECIEHCQSTDDEA